MSFPHESATQVLKQYWGYESFLPLQQEAIEVILNRQDSVVILPTGGGKSLCFQLPVLLMEGTVVVVSPLVSLMKDQVDGLNGLGISAGYFNSSLSAQERHEVVQRLRAGKIKLLYVAPERFASEDFIDILSDCKLAYFVIDEAHCISQWGHDFRPDYRMLGKLHQYFPGVAIHAFTATATEPVREDMNRALNLVSPKLMIGDFDRPNLLYRAQHRHKTFNQVCDIIDRHVGEPGIIYCIRRAEVNELTASLKERGLNVLPYHAGLSDNERKQNQDAFITETVDIVVATVAFGMGIDRSNIRYVIHTGMPKSIEHYQQEAGRAGRDRLEAECILLYSGADVAKWHSIMGDAQSEQDKLAVTKLYEMSSYCQMTTCRHRYLVEYFGQPFAKENCGRCDYCLGEQATLEDSKTVARKILSCVARVKERFGGHHVAQVLKGANTEKIRQFGHGELSTYGLLSDFHQGDIVLWVDQLVYQGFLQKDPQYGSLKLSPQGVALLRGDGEIALAQPVKRESRKAKKAEKASPDWEGVDEELFETLRKLRRNLAVAKRVPPYIIFSDMSLREMARNKPTRPADFRRIKGVGEQKFQEFGMQFLEMIQAHVLLKGESESLGALPLLAEESEVTSSPLKQERGGKPKGESTKEVAFRMFQDGATVVDVQAITERAWSTVTQYGCEYIRLHGLNSPDPWLSPEVYHRVTEAFHLVGPDLLKPIFEHLNGEVSYEEIHLAKALFETDIVSQDVGFIPA